MDRPRWVDGVLAAGATIAMLVLAVHTLGRRIEEVPHIAPEDPAELARLQELDRTLGEVAAAVRLESSQLFTTSWVESSRLRGSGEVEVRLEHRVSADEAERARAWLGVRRDVYAIVRAIESDPTLRASDLVLVTVHPSLAGGVRGLEPIGVLELPHDALDRIDWRTQTATELWDLAAERGRSLEPSFATSPSF